MCHNLACKLTIAELGYCPESFTRVIPPGLRLLSAAMNLQGILVGTALLLLHARQRRQRRRRRLPSQKHEMVPIKFVRTFCVG